MHDHDDKCCGQHGQDHAAHAQAHRGHHEMRGIKHIMGHMQGFGPGGMRARRGDVRAAILRLLAESPMHGYQIIQELAKRSEGAWSPSAGSVYPTLQMLADEDLVTAQESAGKRVFSLTDAGAALVAQTADQPAPWEEVAASDTGTAGLREAAGRLMPALLQVGKSGSADQVAAAIEIVNDARKKIYAVLAQD